jgi:mRNA interferase MazF
MKIQRYDIFLAELSPTRGAEISKTRPVLIISQDDMNAALLTVVVCPLTTIIHPGWRSRIQIRCAGKPAEIAVDQIRTISKERLIKKLDRLPPPTAKELRLLISEMYGQ